MHRLRTSNGDGVSALAPAFITKLHEIVSNPQTQNLIGWGANNDTIVIRDKEGFATRVLPSYFNHKNVCSFVRQLHIYGFTKVGDSSDILEFRNENFKQSDVSLLRKIVRRKPEKRLASNDADEDHPKARLGTHTSPTSNASAEMDEELADLRHEVQRLNKIVGEMASEMSGMRIERNKLIQGVYVALSQISSLRKQGLKEGDLKPFDVDPTLSTGIPFVDAIYHHANPHVGRHAVPSHDQVWRSIAEVQGVEDSHDAAFPEEALSASLPHPYSGNNVAGHGPDPSVYSYAVGGASGWDAVGVTEDSQLDAFVNMFQGIGAGHLRQ